MTCSQCYQPTENPAYNTRYCGCWKDCTHPVCGKCDEWKDKLVMSETKAREL